MTGSTAVLSQWERLEETSGTYSERLASRAIASALGALTPPEKTTSVFDVNQLPGAPAYPVAQWFDAVQQRIVASVPPAGYTLENDGTWIDQEIATTAVFFLGQIADAFATEPYLYSSPSGNSLVAEFSESGKKMTFDIFPEHVTAYSMKEGQVIGTKYSLRDWSLERLNALRSK
jgi:hypothetical protein